MHVESNRHVAVALSDAAKALCAVSGVSNKKCHAEDDMRLLTRHGAVSSLRQQALLTTKMHISAHLCSKSSHSNTVYVVPNCYLKLHVSQAERLRPGLLETSRASWQIRHTHNRAKLMIMMTISSERVINI